MLLFPLRSSPGAHRAGRKASLLFFGKPSIYEPSTSFAEVRRSVSLGPWPRDVETNLIGTVHEPARALKASRLLHESLCRLPMGAALATDGGAALGLPVPKREGPLRPWVSFLQDTETYSYVFNEHDVPVVSVEEFPRIMIFSHRTF